MKKYLLVIISVLLVILIGCGTDYREAEKDKTDNVDTKAEIHEVASETDSDIADTGLKAEESNNKKNSKEKAVEANVSAKALKTDKTAKDTPTTEAVLEKIKDKEEASTEASRDIFLIEYSGITSTGGQNFYEFRCYR